MAGSEAKSGLDTNEELFTSSRDQKGAATPVLKNRELARIHAKRSRVERAIEMLDLAILSGHPYAETLRGWVGRMEYCGDDLVWQACPEGHHRRLRGARFCQTRGCPICAWRNSLKVKHQLRTFLTESAKQGHDVLFLTLTLKNQKDIFGMIDRLWKAYASLRRRKLWKPVQAAFARIEITWSPDGHFHPHMHLLLAVDRIDRKQLAKGKRTFDKEALSKAWLELTGDSYMTRADGIKAEAKHYAKAKELAAQGIEIPPAILAAVDEVAKYIVKDSEFFAEFAGGIDDETGEVSDEKALAAWAWADMLEEIHGRNMQNVTGYWRGIEPELDEADEEAAIWIGEIEGPGITECPTCQAGMHGEHYKFDSRGYYVVRRGPWREFEDLVGRPEREEVLPPRPEAMRARLAEPDQEQLWNVIKHGEQRGVTPNAAWALLKGGVRRAAKTDAGAG